MEILSYTRRWHNIISSMLDPKYGVGKNIFHCQKRHQDTILLIYLIITILYSIHTVGNLSNFPAFIWGFNVLIR